MRFLASSAFGGFIFQKNVGGHVVHSLCAFYQTPSLRGDEHHYGFIFGQVGNFVHYLSTFLAGLVVGFISAWKLALLSIAVIPGIAFAGGLYAYTLTGLTSKSRESYANAGIVAEQVSTCDIHSWHLINVQCRYFNGLISK